MTTRAFVALGSNLGERSVHLERALRELDRPPDVRVVRCSSFHETEPVGGPAGQGPYLNAVVELATALEPRALLHRLLEIELRAGRVRRERNGPRTLDLDLLIFGDQRIDTPELCVPHPRLEERSFVLAPLAEFAPELLLARSGSSVRERLAALRAAEGRA